MLTALRMRAMRPLVRWLKEIWDTKFMLAWTAGFIHFGFPHGFHGLWTILTTSQRVSTEWMGTGLLVTLVFGLILQVTVSRWMWSRFRLAQTKLPPPWKGLTMADIFEALSAPSALRGLHFIWIRFGSQRRLVIRNTPWHFRHSLITVYYSILLFGIFRVSGARGLLMVFHLILQLETFWLLFRQAAAAFGIHHGTGILKLDYQHKPRFAQAVLLQFTVFCTALALLLNRYPAIGYIMLLLPLTSFGTLLLYLVHAHEPDYVNPVPVIYGTPSEKLCNFCKLRMGGFNDHEPHHMTRGSLQRSAQNGCRICAAVWQNASHIPEDFVKSLKIWQSFTSVSGAGFGRVICNDVLTEFESKSGKVPDVYDKSNQGTDIRNRIALEPLSNHTGSDQSLDLAVKWLNNCMVFHGVCSQNHDKHFRPSRLLYIDEHSVCVHSKNEMPTVLRYLTLSHCWGRHQLVRLLESNLEAFRHEVPYALLPQTFRDAIRLTRRLGFHYLWIDSLCIIQDSKDDWTHEARLMGKIYTNATCNIAASDAPDSSHGCLYPRNPRTIQPEAIDSSNGREQFLLNRTDVYQHHHVLYTRAWVLQEAILARRTLDCGRGQLFWRCGEMRASEVWPGGVPTNIFHDDHPASIFKAISAQNDQVILSANSISQRLASPSTRAQMPRAPGKGPVNHFTDSPFGFWAAISEHYSRMHLTQETDRHIAMRGITDIFRPHFGTQHYATWHIFLPQQLLWTVSRRPAPSKNPYSIPPPHPPPPPHPSPTPIPTWSWLSATAPISHANCSFTPNHDLKLTHFLRVLNTHLALKTRLLNATCTLDSRPPSIETIKGKSAWLTWHGIRTLPDDYGHVYFDHEGCAQVHVVLLCVLVRRERRGWEKVVGLVVREVGEGVYVRLGCFVSNGLRIVDFLKGEAVREVVLV